MGTNYYARIIPSKERREKIKNAIDKNDFDEIKSLVAKTYYEPQYDTDEGKYTGGEIHLGKRSGGWKFLWNPNYYKELKGHTEWVERSENYRTGHWVEDGFEINKFYDLTKKSIKQFIDREDIEIYDEYGEKQDKEEFWQMALNWGYEKGNIGWDGEAYEEWQRKENKHRTCYDHYNDYCRFLESCGIKLNKYNTDFYSDGLRFATSTDFC